MPVHSDSDFRDDFLEGAAKAFFVIAYAKYCEHNPNCDLPQPGAGGDWMNCIPDQLPGNAYAMAGELWAGLAFRNPQVGCGVYSLANLAADADGIDHEDLDAVDFGHYLAMQSMGCGTSWFDDHAKFPLSVPTTECGDLTFDSDAYGEGL